MIIPISLGGSVPEWCLIELQGTIRPSEEATGPNKVNENNNNDNNNNRGVISSAVGEYAVSSSSSSSSASASSGGLGGEGIELSTRADGSSINNENMEILNILPRNIEEEVIGKKR